MSAAKLSSSVDIGLPIGIRVVAAKEEDVISSPGALVVVPGEEHSRRLWRPKGAKRNNTLNIQEENCAEKSDNEVESIFQI
ncbi:unnamed protein product [Protopolystoma xenopodis]|uniref:Uncharacterized protein n=1 Tax=Protopolystoma xenopodis TaxID=117903 RepID=A0A3S4ZI42_9PLAT|nr:unnamed protein product [Protopolystoma xenopodis]